MSLESSGLEIPPLFAHQSETIDLIARTKLVFDMSDPGTGKTRSHAEPFAVRRKAGAKPALVIGPKSILKLSWADDIKRFCPGMTCSIATAANREKAFATAADFYITNHDAVVWLAKRPELCKKFSTIIVDESTAFKNPQSDRSKAMKRIRQLGVNVEFVALLTATPIPKSITELWHQMLVLDNGERLGSSFYSFRSSVCAPIQDGPGPNHIKWVDKDGAADAVFDLIRDVTIRHQFEKCVSIPDRTITYYDIDLPTKLMQYYAEMERHRMLELTDGDIMAAQASAVRTKLLQIASGSVYSATGEPIILDDGRIEIIMDLMEAREQCLTAFLWKHQRDALTAAAKARGLSFGVIDGEAKDADRIEIVNAYQAGKIQHIFAHPQSASHGLTLTKGTTTIWPSPGDNAEHFEQFNRRQYRAGQTKKTEVILLRANHTLEGKVYANNEAKLTRMDELRNLVEAA